MVLAQALGEYGALSGGALANVMAAASDAFNTVEGIVRQTEPTTWVAVVGLALVLWIAFRR